MSSSSTDLPDLGRLPLFGHLEAVPTPSPADLGALADVAARPPAPTPIGTRRRAGRAQQGAPAAPAIDWALVRSLRTAAAKELAEVLRERAGIDPVEHRAIGEQIVADLVRAQMAADNAAGHGADRGMAVQLQAAVLDALFGLGRLQPLVDNPELENIEVLGCDPTVLLWADGRVTTGPPVVDSDEELIEELAFIATRASEANQRTFSPAAPLLNLRLDGGARLAAHAWVSRRPSAIIRLHRLVHVSLADLVARGTMTPEVHDLLARAVRRRMSIVVAGEMGAGKTTLLRALCAEFDPWESIATVETEFELHLDEMPERHRRVHAVEMRPGSGERLADGTIAGEINLTALVRAAWRWNADRLILGEVRGPEVMQMFDLMGGGTGGLCTVHGKDAHSAIDRLVTLAMGAGPQVTAGYAERQVGQHVDLVVHINAVQTETGAKHRHISQILALEHTGDGLAKTELYAAGPDRIARLVHMPANLANALGL